MTRKNLGRIDGPELPGLGETIGLHEAAGMLGVRRSAKRLAGLGLEPVSVVSTGSRLTFRAYLKAEVQAARDRIEAEKAQRRRAHQAAKVRAELKAAKQAMRDRMEAEKAQKAVEAEQRQRAVQDAVAAAGMGPAEPEGTRDRQAFGVLCEIRDELRSLRTLLQAGA